jgi:hypothetical protein
VHGSPCGDRETGAPFASTGWPTKKAATARGAQHFTDHKLGAEIQAALLQALGETEDPEAVDLDAVRAKAIGDSEHSPMQELDDFRADQGLAVVDGSAVSVEDL